MKKTKETLTAVGFKEKLGVVCRGPVSEYEPFEKKGKLGVRYKADNRIVLDAAFTYIEVFAIEYDVFFIVGNEGQFGLYYKDTEIIPVQYNEIVQISHTPKIFGAYVDQKHFDVYWRNGLLTKHCEEYLVDGFYVKVKHIDNEEELFGFIGDYEAETIIRKGKYNIKLYKDYIIVDDGKPVVYNYKGCKISEDVSGKYVQYGGYLVHITGTVIKFYNKNGREIDLYETYDDVVMAQEYVLVKHGGHWRLLYSV